MKMYGYIRVSTVRQGEGVSLEQQRDAITQYAKNNNHQIIEWFEEKATAAGANRPVFNTMMKQLKAGKADGLICHKIDRSARNLKDWSFIGEYIDAGINVKFAHEDLDLTTRGGRLSADIQAVMSADYVRNLRQETIKGIRGRLKQGILPNAAPVGYLNTGKGKPKTIDPVKAPLIVEAYTKYATGNYSLNELRLHLCSKGLTNVRGNILSKSAFTKIMKNPFYTGIILLKTTGEIFEGQHEPIMSTELFNSVQERLGEKTFAKKSKNDFIFRSRIHCQHCTRVLIGERQKGRVYYRCHTKGCATTSIREDHMDDLITKTLGEFVLPEPFYNLILQKSKERAEKNQQHQQTKVQQANLTLGDAKDRLTRLNEKFVDDLIDRDTYTLMKNDLITVINEQEQLLVTYEAHTAHPNKDLELSKIALTTYLGANKEHKRLLLEKCFSNFLADGRTPHIQIKTALWELLHLRSVTLCAPHADVPRTLCPDCKVSKSKTVDIDKAIDKLLK